MAGVEKIIEKIEEDCRINCEEVLRKANGEAQAILDQNQVECDVAGLAMLEAARAKCRADFDIAVSRAENEKKKAVLAAKIGKINGMIAEAIQRLTDLPAPEYFAMIQTLVSRYAVKGEGILHFSTKDSARIPAGFEEKLNEMLKDSGASVKISPEPATIGGGFILSYRDIEQNCTFEALLQASLDEIKDRLNDELFLRDRL